MAFFSCPQKFKDSPILAAHNRVGLLKKGLFYIRMLLETVRAVATDVVALVWKFSFVKLGFFSLFWNFIAYLLLFEGIQNFTAALTSSQNGGDSEQAVIGFEGRDKVM